MLAHGTKSEFIARWQRSHGVAFVALPLFLMSACGDSKSASSDGGTDGNRDSSPTDGATSSDGNAGTDGRVDSSTDGQPSASFDGDRRQPLTPANDVQFIDFFVPHHMSAIEMAMMVIERGTTPAVKTLAQDVKAAQTDEIAKMRAARVALAGVADSPPAPDDPHMQADMKMMMGLSGTALERMFLMDMIPHHAAGLPVAHRALSVLVRSDLKTLAMDIYAAQAREIGKMKMMLGAGESDGGTPAGGAPADGGVDGGVPDDTSPSGDRRIPYTAANDIAFIDFFVPHHVSAVMMADMVIAKGARADVKAMAQMMKTAQTAEIALMKQARQTLAGSAESPAPSPDGHMDADMASMMGLTGAALDLMFIEEMIPHHAGALPTAHRSGPHLQRADMRKLAEDIYDAQAREIGELESMRESGPSDGGTAGDASSGQ